MILEELSVNQEMPRYNKKCKSGTKNVYKP